MILKEMTIDRRQNGDSAIAVSIISRMDRFDWRKTTAEENRMFYPKKETGIKMRADRKTHLLWCLPA